MSGSNKIKPNREDKIDINKAIKTLNGLGKYTFSQGTVVRNKKVIAIIMDGNGRWGLKKKKSRNYGHLKGIKAVEAVLKASIKKKIPFLTLYTFSTENWTKTSRFRIKNSTRVAYAFGGRSESVV